MKNITLLVSVLCHIFIAFVSFQAGTNLNMSRYEHSNCLCMAVLYRLTGLVQYFLGSGADQNNKCKSTLILLFPIHAISKSLYVKEVMYKSNLFQMIEILFVKCRSEKTFCCNYDTVVRNLCTLLYEVFYSW